MRKASFCAIVILKTIILPRQARDKHKETLKREAFSTGGYLGVADIIYSHEEALNQGFAPGSAEYTKLVSERERLMDARLMSTKTERGLFTTTITAEIAPQAEEADVQQFIEQHGATLQRLPPIEVPLGSLPAAEVEERSAPSQQQAGLRLGRMRRKRLT